MLLIALARVSLHIMSLFQGDFGVNNPGAMIFNIGKNLISDDRTECMPIKKTPDAGWMVGKNVKGSLPASVRYYGPIIILPVRVSYY